MTVFRTLSVIALALTATPAAADDAQNACQMGNLSYAIGAGLAQGDDQTLTCTAPGTWVPTVEGVASGCIHNGNHYGIGSFVTVTLDGSLAMTCRADGIWRRYEAN